MSEARRRRVVGTGPGAVEIWLVDLNADGPAVDDCLLSRVELARGAAFKFQRDRRRYLASHLWLRAIVAEYLGADPVDLEFKFAAGERPELAAPASPALCFSMSRSGDQALFGLSRVGAVGVDIEEVLERPGIERLERLLSSTESEQLRSEPPSGDPAERLRALYRLWVRKEAVLKAVGTGLRLSPRDVDVSEPEGVHPENPACTWRLSDLPVTSGCVLAVACAGVDRPGSPMPGHWSRTWVPQSD